MNPLRARRRLRGSVLLYATLTLTALCGIGYLALSVGRMGHAKAQLQAAADAMALHVANGMRGANVSYSDLYNRAIRSGGDNRVEGASLDWNKMTVEIGNWLPGVRQFVANNTVSACDAARVTLWYDVESRKLMPIVPGQAQPSGHSRVRVQAVASVVRHLAEVEPPARGNPYLVDLASGTVTQNHRPDDNAHWDTAGTNSGLCTPLTVSLSGMGVGAGDVLGFDVADAVLSWNGSADATGGPDGDTQVIVTHGSVIHNNGHGNMDRFPANETKTQNGLGNMVGPIRGTVGVFLTHAAPGGTAAPARLDFGTSAARDYARLSPALKQPFFIGDGRNNAGKRQQVVIPAGATRLVLTVMDCWKWRDNVGEVPTIVCEVGHAVLQKPLP